jgi:outer membrane protein OmpA-like peptidoglycan-associated protein
MMSTLERSIGRDGWSLLALAFLGATLVGCATKPEPVQPVAPPPKAQAPAAPAPQAQPPAAQPAQAQPPAAPAPQAQAPAASTPPKPAAAPALPPIMPFNDALLFAANNLFGKAELPPPASPAQAPRYPLVIDPLVDGNSGFQSVATQSMESRITELVKGNYPVFRLEPFTTTALARGPLLFIGTFTAVDKDGKNAGNRDWFRVCLALVDLRSGRIVSKGFARAQMDGVDITPTAFFLDSPAWAPDPATQGYVRTCQGTKVGDPINPVYWDRIVAAAMINDASIAYTNGRYEEALDLYKGVQRMPGGDQLRVYNGVYLAAARLGRQDEAAQAFAKVVDFGLAQNQLAVKFLFRPGSTLFVPDPQISGAYHMWLKQISDRATRRTNCMEIAGHTSRTGPEPVNERLSLMRAHYVKQRLEASSAQLAKRTTAVGMGSRENISGLGTDDARDALDRRVEFKVKDC